MGHLSGRRLPIMGGCQTERDNAEGPSGFPRLYSDYQAEFKISSSALEVETQAVDSEKGMTHPTYLASAGRQYDTRSETAGDGPVGCTGRQCRWMNNALTSSV